MAIECKRCGRVSAEPENSDPYNSECSWCGFKISDINDAIQCVPTIDSYANALNAQDQRHRNAVRAMNRQRALDGGSFFED